MDKFLAKKFYEREDIQKAILRFAKNREIAAQFNTYFGKRPDIIEYITDVKTMVKKGITSFHSSEERWANPLLLSATISDEEKEKNRTGWDLILDLDGVDFEYAKIVGVIIIDYLENELNIKNVSTKFSGNKGFHIGIPFEAFSSNIIGIGETRKLFPEAPRKISMFLMKELEDKIINKIIQRDKTIENISKKYNIPIKDLIIKKNEEDKLNYLKLIEIDTILIASRHLFRMPYSFNEKSGLVSIPIDNNRIANFQKGEARPNNIKPEKYDKYEFLKYNASYGQDANVLLMKAYEGIDTDSELNFMADMKEINLKTKEMNFGKKSQFNKMIYTLSTAVPTGEIYEINEEVKENDFPQTIKYLLNNSIEDGKKRALFVLLSFLHSINYTNENIDTLIEEWNKKQSNPLTLNYFNAQINWFKNLKSKISPPNFNNDNYYESIGIPTKMIQDDIHHFKKIKSKNPLHYIFIMQEQNKGKNDKNKKTKKDENNTKDDKVKIENENK